jgi:hypothetical protein
VERNSDDTERRGSTIERIEARLLKAVAAATSGSGIADSNLAESQRLAQAAALASEKSSER